MKLSVETTKLNEGLRRVLNVVSSRSTIPVLSNVLVVAREGRLKLTTTDLEVCVVTSMAADIAEEGETTLPAKRLGTIVGGLSGPHTTMQTVDHATSIVSGQANYKLLGLDANEYPREGEFAADRSLTLPALEFGKMLRKIGYAVSTDQTRYVLNGILLSVHGGSLTTVATDGRRLALVEKVLDDAAGATDGDAVLPNKAVGELSRLLDSEGDLLVRIGDARASFTFGDTTVITKLVDGTYPTYRQVIPTAFKKEVVIPRPAFTDVLARVVAVITDGGSVKMDLAGTTLTLYASSSDVGEAREPLEVAYSGETITISFNPGFLRDPLRTLECDQLTLRFNDEFKPVVMLGDEGFLYVIMPMRS